MSLYGRWIHRLERNLTQRDTNRRVLPFEWGLDWLDCQQDDSPLASLKQYAGRALVESDTFFATPPIQNSRFQDQTLTFDTPTPTAHSANNTVRGRVFTARGHRAAVVVIPQWNCDAGSHVALCRVLQQLGITALRLTMPYHEERRPPGMARADFMVSPNLGRTLHATRQAVLESMQCVDWLMEQGYGRVGMVGTSVGSCVAYLAFVHRAAIQCAVFNHVSAYFADVVWRGLATRFVRWGLEGHVTLNDLRECWAPISPFSYISRLAQASRPHRLISASYDLTFLPELSELVFAEYQRRGMACDRVNLPCGHYTTARFPFSYLDGWHICSFLYRELMSGRGHLT